jgi:hypothetical protein
MTETAAPSRAILPDELYPAHGKTLTLKPWQGPFSRRKPCPDHSHFNRIRLEFCAYSNLVLVGFYARLNQLSL